MNVKKLIRRKFHTRLKTSRSLKKLNYTRSKGRLFICGGRAEGSEAAGRGRERQGSGGTLVAARKKNHLERSDFTTDKDTFTTDKGGGV